MKNINVQTLNTNEKHFFKLWLMILQPFLKLRKQEINVLARLLYYRYTISKQVKNKSIVDDLLFNTKTRKAIKSELGIKDYVFNNIMTTLRKKKIIVNNSISNKIIPKIEGDLKNFKLVYNIEINETV